MATLIQSERPRIYTVRFVHSDVEGQIIAKVSFRKVSRKRFIGLAMFYGYPPRVARAMAETIQKSGVPYLAGLLATIDKGTRIAERNHERVEQDIQMIEK